ncbi:MAG: acylphosphatase [bacterium]
MCVKLTVKGLVQGVGFRWFVIREANDLGLTGYVKNLYNGDVEIEAEGERGRIEELIRSVKRGPTLSRVVDVIVEWKEYSNKYTSFTLEY